MLDLGAMGGLCLEARWYVIGVTSRRGGATYIF